MTGGPTEHFRDGELTPHTRMARESREASTHSNRQQMWEEIRSLNIQEMKAETRLNILWRPTETPLPYQHWQEERTAQTGIHIWSPYCWEWHLIKPLRIKSSLRLSSEKQGTFCGLSMECSQMFMGRGFGSWLVEGTEKWLGQQWHQQLTNWRFVAQQAVLEGGVWLEKAGHCYASLSFISLATKKREALLHRPLYYNVYFVSDPR